MVLSSVCISNVSLRPVPQLKEVKWCGGLLGYMGLIL